MRVNIPPPQTDKSSPASTVGPISSFNISSGKSIGQASFPHLTQRSYVPASKSLSVTLPTLSALLSV